MWTTGGCLDGAAKIYYFATCELTNTKLNPTQIQTSAFIQTNLRYKLTLKTERIISDDNGQNGRDHLATDHRSLINAVMSNFDSGEGPHRLEILPDSQRPFHLHVTSFVVHVHRNQADLRRLHVLRPTELVFVGAHRSYGQDGVTHEGVQPARTAGLAFHLEFVDVRDVFQYRSVVRGVRLRFYVGVQTFLAQHRYY